MQNAALGRRLACSGQDQPPLRGRLPGFFLLRVWEPRSRLTFWPWPVVLVRPFGALALVVALRSASVTILLPMTAPFDCLVVKDEPAITPHQAAGRRAASQRKAPCAARRAVAMQAVRR